MKSTIILTLLALVFSSFNTVDKTMKIVNKVNKLRTTWQAAPYYRDIRPLLGARRDDSHRLPLRDIKVSDDLPESFDLREQYPYCESIKEIRDQSKCGSCWAFSSAEVMSDRICIVTEGRFQTRVSPQHIITCCTSCGYGCFGGWPSSAFSFWKRSGIPSGGLYGDKNTCKPYFLPPCDDHMHKCHDYQETPPCEKKCQDSYNKTLEEDLTFATTAYSVSGEKEIMQEIYERGSVSGAFSVYEDFGNDKSGIYQHVTGSYLGGHAIKIIGWGVENGVKYWLCANSWNESWGEKGFFRILRGQNECGIEDDADTGMPKIK